MPTGIDAIRKTPSASLTSLRVKPVEGLFAVTVAPGMAAPCGSSTRPDTFPAVCCANTDTKLSSTIATAPKKVPSHPTPPNKNNSGPLKSNVQ